MLTSSLIVLNGLLKKFSTIEQQSILEPLSENVKNMLEHEYTPPIGINSHLFCQKDIINQVHYSWYIPLIDSYKKNDLSLLVYAFDEEIRKELESYFDLKAATPPPSDVALSFFRQLIFDKITEADTEVVPPEYIPDSELNLLLELSKNEIIMLIDYLAIYDLSIQLPKTVDPTTLKKVEAYLSPDKKKLLKTLSFYKQPFTFPPMPLYKADNEEEFNLILHKRGLNRFSKALCNEHKSFIWHICHKLDIGRGKALAKFCIEKTQNEITKTITFNIMELLPIIRSTKQ